MSDYDAIRAELVALCKVPVTLGLAVPEDEQLPRRSSKEGAPITLRYKVTCTVGAYTTEYHFPAEGTQHYSYFHPRAIHVSLDGDWRGLPKGAKRPAPSVSDVLWACLMDASLGSCVTFEEFCGEIGADTDSRRAEAQYRVCQSAFAAMRRAFGADYDKAVELAHQL